MVVAELRVSSSVKGSEREVASSRGVGGGTLQASLCTPNLSGEEIMRTKETTKEKGKE